MLEKKNTRSYTGTGKKEEQEMYELLRGAGLRPTRQRLALGELLYRHGDRHVSAERLHDEAVKDGIEVSLATIYNTLHQFTAAGLLREVAVEGAKTYFDTNVSDHYHFYCEHDGKLVDIEEGQIHVGGLPAPPEGMEIAHVDIMIKLVQKKR